MQADRNAENVVPLPFLRTAHWRGRSGQDYRLVADRLDSFVLSGNDLYVVVHGDSVGWVGAEADLIHDQQSRSRFLLAMHGATAVYHLPAPSDAVARMTMTWDLEGAAPLGILSAA